MNTKMTLIAAAAIAASVGVTLAPTQADAKRGGYYYYNEFTTARPERGYEGFAGIGKHQAYCSYRREPNRKCWFTRSGRERCKVVSWRLIQHCY